MPLVIFATESSESQNKLPEGNPAEPVEKVNVEFWLAKLKTALTELHFEAGVVSMKANKTESFKWLHGVVDGDEVESIAPLIGGGISTIRQNNKVSFIEANKSPFSIESQSIRNFIPPIFYKDAMSLDKSYQYVLVSKNQIGGRSAQLIRIESRDNSAFNFWLWLDVESGLPLRMEYVNQKGEVIERMLITHLTIFSAATENLIQIAELKLPEAAKASIATRKDTNNWQMKWLPAGFELLKSDRHHVSITREVSDYYLYGDGLVEFSVYVQRPLESFKSPLALQEGATSFVMVHLGGFDVTVVGSIPVETAYKVASNINRKY